MGPKLAAVGLGYEAAPAQEIWGGELPLHLSQPGAAARLTLSSREKQVVNLWNILSGVLVLGSCLEMDVMILKLFHVPPDPRADRGECAEGLVPALELETLCSLRLFLVRVTYVLLCCGTHNPKPLGKGWGGFCGPSHGPWQHGDGNVPTTAPSWD